MQQNWAAPVRTYVSPARNGNESSVRGVDELGGAYSNNRGRNVTSVELELEPDAIPDRRARGGQSSAKQSRPVDEARQRLPHHSTGTTPDTTVPLVSVRLLERPETSSHIQRCLLTRQTMDLAIWIRDPWLNNGGESHCAATDRERCLQLAS